MLRTFDLTGFGQGTRSLPALLKVAYSIRKNLSGRMMAAAKANIKAATTRWSPQFSRFL